METEIQSKTGKKYLIKPNKNGGWKVIRSDTRSEENVSDSLIRRTRIRLESGEEIPFRKIDYTVAKETAVVHILKDIINVDHVKKTYSLIKGSSYKKTLFSWEIINRNVVLRYVNKSPLSHHNPYREVQRKSIVLLAQLYPDYIRIYLYILIRHSC